MKAKKTLALITALFLLGTMSAGCHRSTSSSSTKKIAYIAAGLSLPYWRYVANGIQNEVKDSKMDATVQIYDSKNSNATQLNNAQDAIAKKDDIIIISPTDSSACPAVLTAAKAAKIPVIIADVGTVSGDYESLVMTPNEDGAKQVGDYLTSYLKSKGLANKPVAEISLSLARTNGVNRTKGFKEAMDAAGIKIEPDMKQMSAYTSAESNTFAQDLMTEYPDISAIFDQTDDPTIGVVQAVQHAGKGSQIAVVGFDATPDSITAIKNGTLLCVGAQRPALFGATAVQLAQKIFKGETIPKLTNIPILLVTKDNVNDQSVKDELAKDVFPPVEK